MSRPPVNRRADVPAALVAFSGEAALWWLRLLRPGFRHCFVALNDGRRWIVLDPLAPFTEVTVLDVPPGYDLPGWFRAHGLTVAPAAVRRGLTRPAPWAPFTCVEAVKRVLGLHAPTVLTPWQLYRHLTRAGPDPDAMPAASVPALPRPFRPQG
ncbi:hypothetical protein [Azospirillum sp. SYSU D00513]|uniref:hypothetical protein n=1 Tax=Azospirillum sp. SYSU D00513 TaxID=2812561 RepID=UPI001A96EEBE|nr:hypothetical protein [Azospirillum sp. SYSU D00513]